MCSRNHVLSNRCSWLGAVLATTGDGVAALATTRDGGHEAIQEQHGHEA